jgi:peptidoglycan/xylan/chitin deacetylase (PgdA/CDA1 family)
MDREGADGGRDRRLAGYLRRKLAYVAARRPATHNPAKAIISFSFDDAPQSAASCAAEILEQSDARGTFYICGGFAGGASGELSPYADWDALRGLSARGHEIGCHTFSHRNCGIATAIESTADTQRNRAAFEANGLPAPTTFAFPFGDASVKAKSALAPSYALLRGVDAGLLRAGSDINLAPAVALEGEDPVGRARTWLQRAKSRPAWLIFYTHDVIESPSPYGCTPEAFGKIVALARAMDIEMLTVAEGLKRIA